MDLARTRGGRRALFAAYYFVEGAPIGFLWWALPTLLRSRGIGVERIGALLGWLVLPWALKWLWSPLVDLAQGPRWSLRGWIVTAQVGMALTLAPLLFGTRLADSDLVIGCLVAHAVFASTQDAAIDALMVRTTEPSERGTLSGWMQVGMLTARALFGGGALVVMDRLGPAPVVGGLVGVVLIGLGLAILYRAPLPRVERDRTRSADFGAHLRAALARRTTWVGLAFAVLAGAGFEIVGAFAGPLLTDRAQGATSAAAGLLGWPVVAAMAGGSLAGGALASRAGAWRGTLLAGLLLGATILVTATVVGIDPPLGADRLVPWLLAVYVGIGAFTAASYALFMDWTDERLGATQFSAYMGGTNLCESWSVAAAGPMIAALGYGSTFAAGAAFGLVALALPALARRPADSRIEPPH